MTLKDSNLKKIVFEQQLALNKTERRTYREHLLPNSHGVELLNALIDAIV